MTRPSFYENTRQGIDMAAILQNQANYASEQGVIGRHGLAAAKNECVFG